MVLITTKQSLKKCYKEKELIFKNIIFVFCLLGVYKLFNYFLAVFVVVSFEPYHLFHPDNKIHSVSVPRLHQMA